MNIGTIGHVDHGKTTLTAAISSVLSNARVLHLQEIFVQLTTHRKRKSVVLLLTHLILSMKKNRHYAHVDCPGHADYVKNMVTGAAQMDGAILSCCCNRWPNATNS